MVTIIKIYGYDAEFRPIDSTHFSINLVGSKYSPAVYHVGQLRPEMVEQLKAKGLLTSNGSVFIETEEPDLICPECGACVCCTSHAPNCTNGGAFSGS